MNWLSAPLQQIAPSMPASCKFDAQAKVWQLSLDQIVSETCEIVGKTYGPAEEAGTSTFCFDTGNVLYSKLRPYLNKVIVPNEPGMATTELVPLRPDPALLNPAFLAYYLRSPGFVNQASHHVAGAKMPRVVMDWLRAHPMPIPSLKEQARIVEILDEAERLRRRRRDADAKAARILPALFLKLFGDPGANPRRLRKEQLGKLIKVKSGNFLPAKDMAPDGKFCVYGGNGVNGYHDQFMFAERKIVLGRVGVYCGAIHYSQPNSWITDNAMYVSEKADDLHDQYLLAALEHANLNQYAGRAGQPLISGSRIYPIEILVPPAEEQVQFGEATSVLDRVAESTAAASMRLDRVWALLMARAFSGQLTAKWRQAHMKELLAEVECQARALSLPVPREIEVAT